MSVFVLDHHWENLLDFFDICLDFIDAEKDALTSLRQSAVASPNPGFLKQCKKCRRVVLLEEQVMNHTPGEADQEFDAMFPNMIGDVHNKNPAGVEDDVSEGKLMCPECKARIGSFDWSGSYCNCGSKIVPAFQLQMSRVDVITVKDDKKKKKKQHEKKRI